MESAFPNLVSWLLQSSLLIFAAATTLAFLRITSPGVKYGCLRVLLLACLTLPVVQPWKTTSPRRLIHNAKLSPVPLPVPSQVVSVATPSVVPFQRFSPSLILLAALGGGALVRIAWVFSGVRRLRRLRAFGEPSALDPGLCAMIGVRAELRYVDARCQPSTFGLIRPVIILPCEVHRLPQDMQRTILAHELWHVRRRDWSWTVMEELLRSIFWFHPAVSWLISSVQSCREQVVDELTILSTNAKRIYIDALLQFADRRPSEIRSFLLRRRQHLRRRIETIAEGDTMSSWRIVVCCVVLTCVSITTAGYGAAAFPMVRGTGSAHRETQIDSGPQAFRAKPATSRENEVARLITAGERNPELYLELAGLQQARGAISDAEATLQLLARVQPDSVAPYLALANLYRDTNRSIAAAGALDRAAMFNLSDPNFHHMLATLYGELVKRDPTLDFNYRRALILRAIAAEDRALAIWPDFTQALSYREALRTQEGGAASSRTTPMHASVGNEGISERLPDVKARPTAETEAEQSVTLWSTAADKAQPPVHAGVEVPPPAQQRYLRPELPDRARKLGLEGTVLVEIIVNGGGEVIAARVVRSIPLLDQVALDTVRQWSFASSTIGGKPVSVVMTVPVTFERK